MFFRCSDLRWATVLFLVSTGCSTISGSEERTPVSRLHMYADGLPELTGIELTAVADDSVIIRAVVEGDPDAYNTPLITATDPAVLEARGDGSAAVRYLTPALVLTATATPKAPSARHGTLVAGARLNLACTAEARPGLSLTVVDSISGQAPAGPGTMRFRATSGSYIDSLTVPALISGWSTAWERRGTFSVAVDADGFQPWRGDGIVVTGGLCHVRNTRVVVRLQRR